MKLSHPNILQVDEFHHFDTEFVSVMPLSTGMNQPISLNLKQYLASKEDQKLSEEEARCLISDICKAVNYAHQKGIIHGNLKPSSIIIETSTENKPIAKVLNFGYCDYKQQLMRAGRLDLPSLMYIAPENLADPSSDFTTSGDIWSIGLILYFMLTGKYPFKTNGIGTRFKPSAVNSEMSSKEQSVESIIRSGFKFSSKARLSKEARDLLHIMLQKDTIKPVQRKHKHTSSHHTTLQKKSMYSVLNHPWFKISELELSRSIHDSQSEYINLRPRKSQKLDLSKFEGCLSREKISNLKNLIEQSEIKYSNMAMPSKLFVDGIRNSGILSVSINFHRLS